MGKHGDSKAADQKESKGGGAHEAPADANGTKK